MGQSLKSKFNGETGEVVKYARDFGITATMEEYQVKDYVAMLTFLNEQAPGEVFRAAKVEHNAFAGPDAFDKFCEAMLRKFAGMERVNKAQADRIIELEKQIAIFKGMSWQSSRPLVQGLMEYCKSK